MSPTEQAIKVVKKKKCKHNGGVGYWSNMKGSVCLKCGKELLSNS